MQAPLRVVIYAAKSTADEKGSIAQQIAECEAHAAAQGWAVDDIERDEAASAWAGNRGPGLERAMRRAEALASKHGLAGLLVWKSNRLARGELVNEAAARHLIDYFRWADRNGVKLLSVTDPATFTNSLVAFVVGEMNAQESKAKSDAVRRALRDKRSKGVHPGGFVYGYQRDPERGLRPDPATAPVVRRIFTMIANGASQAEVVRTLTAEGVPSPRGGSSGWVQGSLSVMLRRRTYLGEVPADDPRDRANKDVPEAWLPGKHEAIVSHEVWEAAQAANARRARRPGNSGGRPPRAGHLLTGRMLHHAACGRAMVPRSYPPRRTDGHVKGVYTCSGAKGGACEGLTVPMEVVDDAIIEYVSEVGIDVEATMRLLTDATRARREAVTNELSAARRELAQLEEQRARMWADRRAGRLDDEDWQTFKFEYTEEFAATEARVAQLEARLAQVEAAPLMAPAVSDALTLIRQFVAAGNTQAVRSAVRALFKGFLVGCAADLAEAPVPAGGEVDASRRELRARLLEAERAVGRTSVEANRAAYAEAEPPAYPPAPDPLTEGLAADGLILLPEPCEAALATALGSDGSVLLVDDHGRNVFRRVALQTTDGTALHT